MGLFEKLKGGKKACAVAIAGDKALALRLSYSPSSRELNIDFARLGTGLTRDSVAEFFMKLPNWFKRSRVWVPVYVMNISEQNKIHVQVIESADARSRSDVEKFAETQLIQDEDPNEKCVHSLAEYVGGKDEDVWIAGSVPLEVIKRTYDFWRKTAKFSHPKVGSRHVGLVNLYLALHDKAVDEYKYEYTIVTYWSRDMDIICLMKGESLIDSGNSDVDVDDFGHHVNKLDGWSDDFRAKWQIPDPSSVSGCVVSADDGKYRPDGWNVDSLEFWPIPWDRIKSNDGEIGKMIEENRELAVLALGLALHGV